MKWSYNAEALRFGFEVRRVQRLKARVRGSSFKRGSRFKSTTEVRGSGSGFVYEPLEPEPAHH